VDKFLSDPAGRLYRFLEHCGNENANDTILEGWRRYLDLPAEVGRVEIVSGVAPLFPLPDLVVDLLRSTEHAEENLDDYTPALTAARNAMSVVVESTSAMSVMKRHFDAGDVESLKSCSRILQRLPGVGIPTDAQLDEVRSSAQDLIDSILNAKDLPSTVRETLLGYAHAAVRDVDLFKIGGLDALVQEAHRFRGQVETNPGSILPPAKEKGVWAELKRFATALGIFVMVSHAPIAIGEDINEYRRELLSITAPAPAELVAPGPALEASPSGESL
jgi:hypothetical protein